MITVALGGRVAEELFFGKITTGASDDLKKCTQIATAMITEYGMSKELGCLNYATENGYQKGYSDHTNQIIDAEVNRIINRSYVKCREILEEKQEFIKLLAERLLETETLSLPDIVEIMGDRPFPMKENVTEYLKELKERELVDEQLIKEEEELKAAQEAKRKED